MTATDELRRLLDERGVEWMPIAWNPKRETYYHTSNGVGFCADEYADGVKIYTDTIITPEQAIDATLGETPTSPPPTPPKQPPYDELIESLRRDWDIEASWDGLRRFWYIGLTDEGVRKRDEREATLELGTCRDLAETPKYGDKTRFECSACGYEYSAVGGFGCDYGDEPDFNYCPNCGRRVEQ